MKGLALVAMLLTGPVAASETWVVVNVGSWHEERIIKRTGEGARQFNPGLGVEWHEGQFGVAGGGYLNSYSAWTAYALGLWMPLDFGAMRAGFAAGAVTGYYEECGREVCPAAALVLEVRYEGCGLNTMVIPPLKEKSGTVVGLQLKCMLPRGK